MTVVHSEHRFKSEGSGSTGKKNWKKRRRLTPQEREERIALAREAVQNALRIDTEENWNNAVKRLLACGAFYETPVFITFLEKCSHPLIRTDLVDKSIDYLQTGIRKWEIRNERSIGRALFLSHRIIRFASDERGCPKRFNEVDVFLKVYWGDSMPSEIDEHLVKERRKLEFKNYHHREKGPHSRSDRARKHRPNDQITHKKGGAHKDGRKGRKR